MLNQYIILSMGSTLLILQFVCLFILFIFRKKWETKRLEDKHEVQTAYSVLLELYKQQSARHETLIQSVDSVIPNLKEMIQEKFAVFEKNLSKDHHEFRSNFDKHLLENFSELQKRLSDYILTLRKEFTENLKNHLESLEKRFAQLIETTDKKLHQISGAVEKRLSEGFEKTTATFADVLKRLALIDEAQKKITELSGNVVSLQEVLADKRARGAFGEMQLANLIQNMLPANHYSFQYQLKNNKRADCILFLPEPSGNMVIDAKFPLETFQKYNTPECDALTKESLKKQFRLDIKKHIDDIAEKYIIPTQTADGAIMFIPAEAIFAEIHSIYPDLVELSHQKRVWLASPTTMMAILTTVKAVIKDTATRKQLHLIQEHLQKLGTEFNRFHKRMDHLAKHIERAHDDVKNVHTTAKKITHRFQKIERVDLLEETGAENQQSLNEDKFLTSKSLVTEEDNFD